MVAILSWPHCVFVLHLYLMSCICICICIWSDFCQCICICIWNTGKHVFVFVFVFDKTYMTPALAETPSPAHNVCCCSTRHEARINTWLFEDPTGLRCKGESEPINGRTVTEVDVDGTMLDVEATIGYLDDMLCFGGGCGSAIAATFCVAWEKFRNLLPVLTTRHLSPRICRKMYQAGVRSAMLHGNETWGPKEPKLRCLQCNDRVMTH